MKRTLLALAAVLGLAAGRASAETPDAKAGADFLAANEHAAGVISTPSGLQYRIEKSGPASGAHPRETDQVTVQYEGKLLSGAVFDSSYKRGEPASFPVTGVIPGWTEALQLMRPGDVWTLWIPPALAYGDEGVGPIPPSSVLVFKIELLSVGAP